MYLCHFLMRNPISVHTGIVQMYLLLVLVEPSAVQSKTSQFGSRRTSFHQWHILTDQVSTINHLDISDINHLHISDINHLDISDINHLDISDMNHLDISDMNHLDISDMNHLDISDIPYST